MKANLVIVSVLFLFNLTADEWPKFLGPDANGISKETGINKDWTNTPPKVLWKKKLTDQGHSVPCIAKGKVFVLDHKDSDDIVRAFELESGKELWTYKYSDADRQKWGFTRTAPIFHNGKLYTQSRNGKALCLDAETGKKVWEIDFSKEFGVKPPKWGFSSSPVLDGEKLILCPLAEGAMMITVNPETGEIIWKGGGSINIGYSTPTIQKVNGEKQYVVANRKGLAGISPEDGKVLWSVPFKTRHGNNIACPIVFDKNKIFITAGYNHGAAVFKVENNQPEKIWENSEMQSHFNTPIMIDGVLYGIGKKKSLICLDPQDGKVLWSQPGFGKGGIIAVDGVLIAVDGATSEIIMVKINKKKYEELGRIKPLSKDKMAWTPPVLSDKKLIVRNRSEIVCLDLAP